MRSCMHVCMCLFLAKRAINHPLVRAGHYSVLVRPPLASLRTALLNPVKAGQFSDKLVIAQGSLIHKYSIRKK